jgi:hypothetical protein
LLPVTHDANLAAVKPRWQEYLDKLEAAGWRVKYKERDGLRGSQWKAEAIKRDKRLSVTAATLDEALLRLWQIS